MQYIGSHCPVCGEAFAERDDVVFCPVCGTPHHRACYESRGRCANEARHAEGYVWAPDAPAPPAEKIPAPARSDAQTVVCPRCGTPNAPEEPVCTSCGERLYQSGEPNAAGAFGQQPPAGPAVQIQPGEPLCGGTVAEAAAFVRYAAQRYIPKFYKREKAGKKASFNWAAFFFTPYWFFYRKLYLAGGIFLVLQVLLSLCTATPHFQGLFAALYDAQLQFLEGGLSEAAYLAAVKSLYAAPEFLLFLFGSLALHLAAAFSADALYYRRVTRELAAIRTQSDGPEATRLLFLRRGGTSALFCAASMVIFYVLEQVAGVAFFSLLS